MTYKYLDLQPFLHQKRNLITPKHLKEMFGDRRWIDVQDPSLLGGWKRYDIFV